MAVAGLEARLRPGRPGFRSAPERPKPAVGPSNWRGRSSDLRGRDVLARSRFAAVPRRNEPPSNCALARPTAPMSIQHIVAAIVDARNGSRGGGRKRLHAADGVPPMGPSPTTGSAGTIKTREDFIGKDSTNRLGRSTNAGEQGGRGEGISIPTAAWKDVFIWPSAHVSGFMPELAEGELPVAPTWSTIVIEPLRPGIVATPIEPMRPFNTTCQSANTGVAMAPASCPSHRSRSSASTNGLVRLQAPPLTGAPIRALQHILLRDGRSLVAHCGFMPRDGLAALITATADVHRPTVPLGGGASGAVITHKVPAPVTGGESARAPTL